MSDDAADIVRRGLEQMATAIRRHELPREDATRFLHPEVRLDVSRRVFNPRVYEGIAGLHEMIEDIWEVWDDFELRPTEFISAGNKVVVLLEERARARNGLETTREIAYLYTVQAGRVTEWIGAMDPAEARQTIEDVPTRK
jgi:hypothetical protein